MSLRYSTTSAANQQISTNITTLLDDIRDTMVTATMTELDGLYSTARFTQTTFDPADGFWVQIDGPAGIKRYQFYDVIPPGGVVPVPTGGSNFASYQNLRDAINANDGNVYATIAYSGTFNTVGIQIRGQNRGTSGNGFTLSASSAAFGNWNGPDAGGANDITLGGGWRLLTGLTPEGLRGRMTLIQTASGSNSRIVYFRITSSLEDVISDPIQIDVTTLGINYRFLAGFYNLAIYSPADSSASRSMLAQIPAMPDFLKGIRITAATNTAPISCTSASAHNLVTGDEVFLADCVDTATISSGLTTAHLDSNGDSTLAIQLTLVDQPWSDGDIVTVSGSNVAADADGIWTIDDTSSTTIDLLLSVGNGELINTGTVTGPRKSMNGAWTVTVTGPTTFTLDGSDGTLAGTYQSSSGLMAKTNAYPQQLSRCLLIFGSDGAERFRNRMFSASSNDQTVVVNSTSYGASNTTPGIPRLFFPGIQFTTNLLWPNGCAVLCEPYIAVGPNGIASDARVVGQLWDAFVATENNPLDSTTTFDTHDWVEYGANGDNPGGLWLVEP